MRWRKITIPSILNPFKNSNRVVSFKFEKKIHHIYLIRLQYEVIKRRKGSTFSFLFKMGTININKLKLFSLETIGRSKKKSLKFKIHELECFYVELRKINSEVSALQYPEAIAWWSNYLRSRTMVNCGLWLLSVDWAVVIFKKCFLKLKEQNYCFYFHSCTQLQRFNSSGLFDERPGAMSHSHPFS